MKNTDEALGRLIEKGIEIAEKTGSFAIEQAPELLQEFYRWQISKNIFGVLIGVLLIFAAYKILKVFGSDESDFLTEIEMFGKHIGVGTIICSGTTFLMGLVFFLCSIYELIFIYVAPKLYLIQHFIR